jgi:hypothetical protein
MTIIQPPANTTFHTSDFWVFWLLYFENNKPNLRQSSVGVYNEETNPNGAQTEADAIEIMKLNIPELEV